MSDLAIYLRGKIEEKKEQEPKWTENQLKAINSDKNRIYVTASAGSGKTAVLTKRIVKRIENGLDLDDVLVATFTKAAANELKNKIAKALRKQISKNPKDEHIKAQMFKVKSASISTYDSFFLDVVQDNYNQLSLPSSFGIIDGLEEGKIFSKTINSLVNEYYNGEILFDGKSKEESIDLFKQLLISFGDLDDIQQFEKEIVSIYSSSLKYVDMVGFITNNLNEKSSFENTKYYECVLLYFKDLDEILSVLKKEYESNYAELKEQDKNEKELYTKFSAFCENVHNIVACFEKKDIENAIKLINLLEFNKNNNSSNETLKFIISKIKDEIIKDETYKKIKESIVVGKEKLDEFTKQNSSFTNAIASIVIKFHERVIKEKKSRRLFSFDDITRFAYELLFNKEGVCERYSEVYKEIYLDEYQDTNEIQTCIFDKLAEGNILFLVGDVKQSIYNFRGGDPTILSNKIRNKDDSIDHIVLKENFRSLPRILESVNYIFEDVAKATRTLDYGEEEKLLCGTNIKFNVVKVNDDYLTTIKQKKEDIEKAFVYSKNEEEIETIKKNVSSIVDDNLIEYIKTEDIINELKKQFIERRSINSDFKDCVLIDESSSICQSVEHIFNPKVELCITQYKKAPQNSDVLLQKINEVLCLGYSYNDIAILTKKNTQCSEIADILNENGIPCVKNIVDNFFDNPEIITLVCLLQTINNTRKDTYVAGCANSPTYCISLSDMIRIKSFYNSKNDSLFDLFIKYSSDDSVNNIELKKKVTKFVSDITRFKEYASYLELNKLLDKIYFETEFVTLSMLTNNEDYESIKNNLDIFRNVALSFEGDGFKTLYDFIEYIEYLKNNNSERIQAISKSNINSVIISTIHKSKGLEYPCVIMYGVETVSKRNRNIIVSKNLGLTNRIVNKSNYLGETTTYESLLSNIASDENYNESLDEDARVLYVGMTRARERLYVIDYVPNKVKESVLSIPKMDSQYRLLNKITRKQLSRFMSLILYSIISKEIDGCMEVNYYNTPIDDILVSNSAVSKVTMEGLVQKYSNNDDYNALKKDLTERLNFEYPFKEDANIANKLYVSMIYPGILDFEHGKPDDIITKEKYFNENQPIFIRKDSTLRRASDVGTIMHSFMAYLDLSNVDNYGIEYEIERMKKEQFMEDADVNVLMVDKLDNFCKSSLAHEIRKAKKVYREMRFVTNFPRSYFTKIEERQARFLGKNIVVQGEIDLLYQNENNEWILIDYKTDFSGRKYEVERDFAVQTLINRHALQLSLYKEAAEKIYGIKIDHTYLYSFAIDDTIEISGEYLSVKANLERN